jgi:hypothetical protein
MNWAGIVLIAGGAYLATWPRPKMGQPPVLPDKPLTIDSSAR